ncbi:MAG TPA: hypothetical protein VJV79_18580 [Polyangiaceae bacterium]|nr:hypothetical protein [Polyangiaceae bacterium]
MAAALIVIEIAAPKVSDGALAVLVSACSRAARDAECVLARNASEVQPAAVAIVTVQSEDKMRVEVGVRQGDHDSWRTKDFAFLPADESMDRWRAVGFAIGTLAESSPTPGQETSERVASPSSSAARSSPSPPAPSSASPPPSATAPATTAPATTAPATTAPATSAPASEASSQAAEDTSDERERPIRARSPGTRLFIGAAAIFGPGLDAKSSWRLGSALYLDLAPSQIPVFFTVGGSAAAGVGGSSELTTRWFDVSLGAGMPLLGRLEASGLEFRAQVLAEYFDAHASLGSSSQTMSRWTLGLQGALGGRLQIIPDLALTAEVQAAGLTGETAVVVGGELVGSSTSFRYLGSAGLRVRLR